MSSILGLLSTFLFRFPSCCVCYLQTPYYSGFDLQLLRAAPDTRSEFGQENRTEWPHYKRNKKRTGTWKFQFNGK